MPAGIGGGGIYKVAKEKEGKFINSSVIRHFHRSKF
jgi:hypothetical protein